MQHRWLSLIPLAALACSSGLWAQRSEPSATAAAPPDLSGTWMPPADGHHRRFRAEDAPLQPWALEVYKEHRKGVSDPYRQGLPQVDPFMYCLPSGTPRAYTAPLPFDLVQVPGRIYMVFQTNPLVRYIYTDGRGHPDGFPVTFMGHSIGRWDGDTLVVDTLGIDETSWLDTVGTPHSDALRVEERMRRTTPEQLEINFLFDDPKAYTRPWGGKKVFHLDPKWEMIPGLQCEDRFKADLEQKTLRNKKDWIEFHK